MSKHITEKTSGLQTSYLVMTERELLCSEPIEHALEALRPEDSAKIANVLVEASDYISDQFREQQGGDLHAAFWAPTFMANFFIEDHRLMVTMGLVNRMHPNAMIISDRNTFWVPLDILAGTGTERKTGACTLAQVVKFLASNRWKKILADDLKVVTVIYDAWARHANASDKNISNNGELKPSPPAADRLGGLFPHNTTVMKTLRPLINRLIARFTE